MAPDQLNYVYHIEGMDFVDGVGARRPRTNIDRRKAHRVVPMKVLCLGLPRTGTSSLRVALMLLGFDDTYHMIEMLEENPPDGEMWLEAYKAKFEGIGKPYGREEWDKLLGHCMAVSDWPPAAFAEELIAAYPEAKVLLTVRDSPEAWHTSMMNTIWTGRFILGPTLSFPQWLIQNIVSRPPAWPALQKVFQYGLSMDFPETGKERYRSHNEKVRKLAQSKGKGSFLEYNVKQGWEPLCEFLEVEVPDVPFPRVNDTKQWQFYVSGLKMKNLAGAVAKVVSAVGVVGLGVYLGAKGMGK